MFGKLCCLLILVPFVLNAQENETELSTLPSLSEDISIIDTNYYIEYLQLYKININYSDENELINKLRLQMPLAKAVIEHITIYGHIHSIYELQQIDGMNVQTIKSIQAFIHFDENLIDIVKNGIKQPYQKHQLILQSERKLKKSKAYTIENGYQGSILKESIRVKSNLNEHISIGFSGHKDAGEPYQCGNISYHVRLKNYKKLNELIIGNFQLQFGQGICVGNAIPPMKSLATSSLISIKEGIYASLPNSTSLSAKGLAISFKIAKNIHCISSYSNKLAEASIKSNDGLTYEIGKIQTVNTYRTTSEINQKSSIKSIDVINRIQYSGQAIQIGLSQATHFKKIRSIHTNPNLLQLIGIDSRIQLNNILMFGEFSKQLNSTEFAGVIGSIIRLDKHNDFGLHYRNFSSNFDGEYSNAISNNSCQNERGLLINYNLKLHHYSNFLMFCELYKNPLEKYRVNGSNTGNILNIEYQYSKRNLHDVSFRFRQGNQFINQTSNEPLLQLANHVNKSFRSQVNVHINKNLLLKQRIEFSWFKSNEDSTQKGFLYYIEIQNNCLKNLKICSRLTVFSIDNFNCRIYAFEKDLSSTFKMNAWQNKGCSYYFILQYHVNKNFEIKTKFAGVRYFNVQTIGSGIDQINSNRQHEIKIELQYKI